MRSALALASVLYQPECAVHVGIGGAEPVSERRARHTGCRPRRSALQHEMFAIEEIRGIARVKRKRFETGKWSERRGCPLPAITHHLGKSAPIIGGRRNGNGIP